MLSFRLFLLTYLLLLGSAFANASRWQIQAEFLYLQPSVEDTFFVLDAPRGSGSPIGTRINNDIDFHPGFRVEGIYRFRHGDRELHASYTRLHAEQSKLISGQFLWATMGSVDFIRSFFNNYPGSAFSDLDILYQRADGFFCQKIACSRRLELNLRGGFEYAYIRFREHYLYVRTDFFAEGDLKLNTSSNGIGPQAGLEIDYAVCSLPFRFPNSLSFKAYASGSILTTRTREGAAGLIQNLPRYSTDDEATWRLISAVHARLGLNYELFFSRWSALLEIGYEYDSYYRAITRLSFVDNPADALCYTDYYNLDMQGFYVSAGIRF